MVTDPISDMLIQIKNASRVGKPAVLIPFSNIKMEIAKVLVKEGYLKNAVKRGKKVKKFLACDIVYSTDGKARLIDLKRVSKPSKRVYKGVQDIHKVKQGFGLLVLSTPKGILTNKEAVKEKVGGEALFEIW